MITEELIKEPLFQMGFNAGYEARADEIKKEQTKHNQQTQEAIINAVCGYFDITWDEMKRATRLRRVVVPRHVCMFFLQRYTTLSLKTIGLLLNRVDHTSVIHAIATVKNLISIKDPDMVASVKGVEQWLVKCKTENHPYKPTFVKI
jgi:chromosomal replication initiation ATPase DnaA